MKSLINEVRKKPKVSVIEREIAVCQSCGGTCPKSSNRYFRPTVQSDGTICYAECEHAVCCQIPYGNKTFSDYEETSDNATARRIAKWFTGENVTKSLYLYGETGTGKTFLASLIARQFEGVIFGDVPSLLGKIKSTFDGAGNSQEILNRYGSCGLLVLDDLGAGLITEWNVGIIYEIINRRYTAGKRLIVTSNFDIEGLENRLSVRDSFTAKRITSRLCEMCIPAFLGTTDRRRLR